VVQERRAQARKRAQVVLATAIALAGGARVVLADSGIEAGGGSTVVPVESLVEEALRHNPDIAAAHAESEAARHRILGARALDDPMFEAGLVNAPLPLSLRREDMTMKMLGLSQKLPFPGKRELRHDVAVADASSITQAAEETNNRVARDVRVAYEELRLTLTSRRLLQDTLSTVEQLVALARARYQVGQAMQSDALQAQSQAVRLQADLLRIDQEETMRRSELRRLLGDSAMSANSISPTRATLLAPPAGTQDLQELALKQRPQLKALAALIDKNEHEMALARREFYPDFEVRLGYGLRSRALDGAPRDDMITVTVAVNLPLWRKGRLEPRLAEAAAMRQQAMSVSEGQRIETRAALEQAIASERQLRASAELYRSTLMPQTEAAYESALSAYRVGKVDFPALLDARMRIYEAAKSEADAIAGHNKAIAEIDFLTGRAASEASSEAPQS
jgi:outer membrane protein TolC